MARGGPLQGRGSFPRRSPNHSVQLHMWRVKEATQSKIGGLRHWRPAGPDISVHLFWKPRGRPSMDVALTFELTLFYYGLCQILCFCIAVKLPKLAPQVTVKRFR